MNRLYKLYEFRIQILSISIFIFGLAILSKMFYLQTFMASELRAKTITSAITEREVKGFRGDIYDSNGQTLAETIRTYTFWANTNNVIDREKIITLFSSVFNNPKEHYKQLLSNNKNYILLAHGKYESQCEPILKQLKNIKGLHCDVNISRYYPYRNLTSQVVGYVDRDYVGQRGIEQQFDPLLKGKTANIKYNVSANGRLREAVINQNKNADNGLAIQITIDVNMQSILLDALNKGIKRSGAKNANGVILNPYTGDIIAMASVPDFDPNKYNEFNPSNFSNRTISDAYEPGSTYKIIPLTAALEMKAFNISDTFYCEEGKYQIIPSKIIHDHEPHGTLSLSEIFIYSSNIGLSKMVDLLGAQHIYDYSRRFGFGVRSGVPLPGETSGVMRKYDKWTRLSGPSVSMGQEISINTLQLALAYSAIANGGYLPKARLIKNIYGKDYEEKDFLPKPIRQVMSKNTSKTLLKMMEHVVDKGTANKARIPGFRIGGKTGTAEKFIDGSYSKKEFISSFAAIFPIDNPKYVCVISVDSPDYSRGKHWGNETAAPIVKDIFERIIINNQEFIPIKTEYVTNTKNKKVQLTSNTMLATSSKINNNYDKMPDFRGLTLKQSIKKAKERGLIILPIGTSGRVVWQSISPGKLVDHVSKCTIKLESM